MKRKFTVEMEDSCVTVHDIADCLRSSRCISLDVERTVQDVTELDEDRVVVTDEMVFNRLLKKINTDTDADSCSCWASALDKFCSAIRTRNGG